MQPVRERPFLGLTVMIGCLRGRPRFRLGVRSGPSCGSISSAVTSKAEAKKSSVSVFTSRGDATMLSEVALPPVLEKWLSTGDVIKNDERCICGRVPKTTGVTGSMCVEFDNLHAVPILTGLAADDRSRLCFWEARHGPYPRDPAGTHARLVQSPKRRSKTSMQR